MPQTRIGEYRLKSGNANVPFWRVVPGTTVTALLFNTFSNTLAQVAPNDPATWNTVVLPPRIGVFDIVIRMSEPVVEQALTDAQSVDLLGTALVGQPANGPMPMWEDGSGTALHRVANISFAVRIPQGQTHFAGTLELSAEQNATGNPGVKRVRLPIRVGESERAANLFVFFIATRRTRPPTEPYAWITVPVTTWAAASPGLPVAGAVVDAKVLRDNDRQALDRRNRRVSLTTDAAGLATFQHAGGAREVLAVPTKWPLIFTATQAGFVTRAHLARLEPANIHDNQQAHQITATRLITEADARARLAASTVLLDPGHAVVYGNTAQRRSQEWFVAHRIASRVAETLRSRFALPADHIFMTRTAGFGLIDPGDITRDDAPERGAARFLFDLAGRRVRTRQATLGLHHLSNLVLTGDDHLPQNVATPDRDRLILINPTTVSAIVGRINGGLPAGQRVQPASVRWNAATSRYVCRIERHPPVAGQNPLVADARDVPITTADWFTLADDMIERLADRTAQWSLDLELGSGAGADPATGRPSFTAAVQAAMQGAGARDYFRQQIIAELDLEEPYLPGAAVPNQYRNKETMGWHHRVRRDYINRKNCDIALTIHENALSGNQVNALGMAMLVGQGPPADQVKAAKLFMKYTDPFDQGLRGGGVVENDAGMLAVQNLRRSKHVYFELEFMTSTIQDNPEVRAADDSRYQYQEMVGATLIDTVASQIVAGVVEFIVDPQPDINSVTYDRASLPTW